MRVCPAFFAGGAAILASTVSCSPVVAPPAPPIVDVGVERISFVQVPVQQELTGRVVPYEASEVRPQVSGIIVRRVFSEGGLVTRGSALYQIDPVPFAAALRSAQAQQARVEATIDSARLKAARLSELASRGFASLQDADEARAAYGEARAAKRQAEAEVQSAQINLARATVRAPISGRISRSVVTVGALVTAGQPTALATIYRTDPVYVDAAQEPGQLAQFGHELQSRSPLSGASIRLKLRGARDYPFPGALKLVDPAVDPTTGTLNLRATFPNPSGELLPNAFVRAIVTFRVRANAILVPQSAVSRDPTGKPFVYVVGRKGTAEVRMLSLGGAIGSAWMVNSGLAPGDLIIVENTQKVQPGLSVHAVPASSAAIKSDGGRG